MKRNLVNLNFYAFNREESLNFPNFTRKNIKNRQLVATVSTQFSCCINTHLTTYIKFIHNCHLSATVLEILLLSLDYCLLDSLVCFLLPHDSCVPQPFTSLIGFLSSKLSRICPSSSSILSNYVIPIFLHVFQLI